MKFKCVLSCLFVLIIFVVLLYYARSSISNDPIISFVKLPLRKNNNESVLINIPFHYLINNNCAKTSKNFDKIKIIQIVTSYAENIESRSALRRAYPIEHLLELGIYRVFLLATLKNSKSEISQNAIFNENERFNDIVQGNFYEGYRNLTYKHLMGLKWFVNTCLNIKYIIKMDDDIIVDMYSLLRLIDVKYNDNKINIMGYVFNSMRPIRIKANKWYVTKEEYLYNEYPIFVSGWMYVTNFKTAEELVDASAAVPYFWIDDVYVTGLLAKVANVTFTNVNKYFTTNPEYFECCIRDNVDCGFIVAPSGGDNDLQIQAQKHLLKCNNQICSHYKAGKTLKNSCITKRKLPSIGKGFGKLDIIKL